VPPDVRFHGKMHQISTAALQTPLMGSSHRSFRPPAVFNGYGYLFYLKKRAKGMLYH